MRKRIIITISFVTFLLFNINLQAQEEDKEIKHPTLSPEVKEARPSYQAESGDISFNFSLSQGYDTNVRLSSPRQEDTFSEQDLSLSYEQPLNEMATFFITDDFSNITYRRFSDQSLISNDLIFGLELAFSDKLSARIDYDLEILRYYQLADGDYFSHIPLLELKYYFSENFYSAAGCKYINRQFIKKRVRNGQFQLLTGKRSDSRYASICEVGYIFPRTLLKLKNEYYLNDSNDQYFDYYDYWADTVSLSIIHMFSDKLYGFLSVAHQWKQYDNRLTQIPLMILPVQEDKLLAGYACLHYDISEGVSLGVDYAYRENDSNDPAWSYSGSIISGTVSYNF